MGKTITENLCSDKRMSDVEAAYFAGFTDGEGTITIIRNSRVATRSGVRYRALFSLANSHRETLEGLRISCGNGTIVSNFHKKLKAYHNTVYVLRFNQTQIRHVLPQLLPFLRCKHRQAEIVLQYLAYSVAGTWHQRSQEEWNELEGLRTDVSALNRRGDRPKLAFKPLVLRPSLHGNNQFSKPNKP
jgi:hypothetical protein